MQRKILSFLVKQSKTKLTDRGNLALVDEFMIGVEFTKVMNKNFHYLVQGVE